MFNTIEHFYCLSPGFVPWAIHLQLPAGHILSLSPPTHLSPGDSSLPGLSVFRLQEGWTSKTQRLSFSYKQRAGRVPAGLRQQRECLHLSEFLVPHAPCPQPPWNKNASFSPPAEDAQANLDPWGFRVQVKPCSCWPLLNMFIHPVTPGQLGARQGWGGVCGGGTRAQPACLAPSPRAQHLPLSCTTLPAWPWLLWCLSRLAGFFLQALCGSYFPATLVCPGSCPFPLLVLNSDTSPTLPVSAATLVSA